MTKLILIKWYLLVFLDNIQLRPAVQLCALVQLRYGLLVFDLIASNKQRPAAACTRRFLIKFVRQ